MKKKKLQKYLVDTLTLSSDTKMTLGKIRLSTTALQDCLLQVNGHLYTRTRMIPDTCRYDAELTHYIHPSY